jgi:arylsulfatase A-like enzyme
MNAFCRQLLLLFCFCTGAAAGPNVLVILTDDQGWGDLSGSGNTNLETPNIDRLAVEGASFDRFYVCPVCSPTRAEFLTGRYHPRSGVYSTSAGGERMNLDEKTIGDAFKSAGYATGAFGKWHNGMQYPYHPNGRGFDEFYGFCSGHWGNYFSPMLEHNGDIVTGEGFIIDDLTEKTLSFMEKNAKTGKPFFAYVPFNTPHSPMQVPDRWWDKFKDKEITMRSRNGKKEDINFTRAALAMCENIDWNVGRLMEKLDALEIADDTIVVYFCDNGPNSERWNDDMKGRKGSTDEGGVRSPLFVRWPSKIKSGLEVPQIAGAIDLLPTLAEMAGVQSGENLDGVSLLPLLSGDGSYSHEDRLIVSHWKNKVSVRSQEYRLDDKGALFHIPTDSGQRKNVATAQAEVLARLSAEADGFRKTMLPLLEKDDRPFVIGHPGMRKTQVPARDGVAHGGIVRSNKFPNCSYFTNWKSTEDKIVWAAEVPESGDFDVEIYYTCPQADVGSSLELSFGENRLSAKITEAHDPPAVGAAEDRVKRSESYVKDFKVLKMGTLHLEKGANELVLRATEIPGAQVGEFRLLMLERKG